MSTAVQITTQQFEEVVRAQLGWRRVMFNAITCRENVYDWSPVPSHPHIVIRVFSSIVSQTGMSRAVGGDAIRVCAVDIKADRGYISTVRVFRVEGWRENLRAAVLDVRAKVLARLGLNADGSVPAPAAPEAPAVPTAPKEVADKLFALFAKAGQHLKHPRISFTLPEGNLTLSIAGVRSKAPGSLQITDGGGFQSGKWFGRIETDYRLVKSRDWQSWIGGVLDAFAADIAGFAAQQGKLTGRCVFCRRKLSDARSVEVGYGETCASHHGLQWGSKPGDALAQAS